ncbi:unnamed protein product [Rotaria sordida]|uniref:Leucine-rich repeat-containing protein 27 n=2 Tax=Rotaria sordida TaxID=392033 RepID=A0A818QJ71_9BILA|nr:unnamed protein product [Rotaria sordida]CAF3641779.1 unnamed protein product [Rotaria sordida]
MTNDNEFQPDLSENEEENSKSSNNDIDDNLSELSLSSSPELDLQEKEIQNDDISSDVHDQVNEILHINENKKEDDLTQFIIKAKEQNYNCLDLSKKNIIEFPQTLLEFPSLQYLYLEGNEITQLPDDLFLRLPNLKWIDLRNNKITQIPSLGLDKNHSLRYLLLSGNLIRTLPVQLGKVKGLSALNLDGNPLVHPPLEIVKQGIKAIQQYLRNEHIRHSKYDSDDENYDDDEEQQTDIIQDVWASSDDDNDDQQRRISRSPKPSTILSRPSLILLRKSKKIKKNNQPTKIISNDPVGDTYAARAREEQRLIRMKHHNIKINEELQKVKTKELLYDWKENYRSNQQKLHRKRLIKGKDYQEAVVQAPFGIDPHYISVMDKDQQEMIEKAIRYESRRNRSPESAMREEEERRIRDRQVQDRIREITGKILKRRGEVRGNAYEEKRQAEFELRELRKLESEVKQRRTQIDNRFKAYTGDVKARKKL